MELRVSGLQDHFLTVADNLLAPELLWPIKAQVTQRSVTSLDGGHSLASKFSEPIRASKYQRNQCGHHEGACLEIFFVIMTGAAGTTRRTLRVLQTEIANSRC